MLRHLLSDISLFVEVVNTRSFTRAADRLGIPSSTLSRRISELESAIGFLLLKRSTRKLEITEEGLAYYQRCRHLVEEAQLAHEQISAAVNTGTGVLRISCPPDLANFYLPSVLRRHVQENPAVQIELSLNGQIDELVASQLDVAIRMGHLKDSTLVARELASQLAVAGEGVVVLEYNAADILVRSGHLQAVLPAWEISEIAISVVTRSRLMPARVRRFIDLLDSSLTAYESFTRGAKYA